MKKYVNRAIVAYVLFFLGLSVMVLCQLYMRRYDGNMSPNFMPPMGRSIAEHDMNVKFAVVGDFDMRNDGLEDVIKEIVKSDVDFILCTGDIANKPDNVRHYNWIAERLKKIKGDIPFFATPGNWDREEASEHINSGTGQYRDIFGMPSYWFGYGDTMFVALDSSGIDISEEDLVNFEDMLMEQRHRFKNLVVFSHVPPLDFREKRPPNDSLPKATAEKLEEILNKYDLTLYLSGHLHEFHEWQFSGAPLVVGPAASQKSRAEHHGNGYLIVSLDNNDVPQVEFHDYPGRRDKMQLSLFLSTKLNHSPWVFFSGMLLALFGWFLKPSQR